METLSFFVPSNRVDSHGKPTHVDGWNEYIRATNLNRYAGNALEQENVSNVANFARAAMLRARWKPKKAKCRVYVTFVEVDRRRDVSNVYGGLKWVLDGLTARHKRGSGAIWDDSPRWVEVHTALIVDRARPGVQIEIERGEE